MHEMINPDMKNQKPYVVAGLYDVTKTVNGKQIVRGVDLEVQHGETLLITGPSGSGKSTCVRMLADLERPTTGDVGLFGSSLQDMKPKTTRQVIAERVSVATQDPSLAKNRTAWENLTRITEGIGGTWSQREISERAGHVALELGIVDLLERKTKTLSGGEQCWVAIGRALVKQPDLVILDEPTHMIDPEGTAQIFEKLSEFKEKENMSMVIVSHDVDQARQFADREIMIDSGLRVS